MSAASEEYRGDRDEGFNADTKYRDHVDGKPVVRPLARLSESTRKSSTLGQHRGHHEGDAYYTASVHRPHPLTSDEICPDPPHERENIDTQINSPGKHMDGFVKSYSNAFPHARGDAVMEYCGPKNLYVTDPLARHFAVCDHWHSCLPASTLPNRLMAMSGYALVDRTPNSIFELARNLFYDDPDDLVYDWLKARDVSWRLYYSGSFFFMQMPRMLQKYESDSNHDKFRPISRLIDDFKKEDVAQVTFVGSGSV